MRLDQYLVDAGLVETRSQARALIIAGKVRVNDQIADKPGTKVNEGASVHVEEKNLYVSRGGLKLASALDHFEQLLDLKRSNTLTALDIGASTGGFTDCLLQRGFSRVHAIDVGYGQLDWRLRNDPRVKVLERVNIRHLEFDQIGEKVDLIVIDVSFISVSKFIERLAQFLKPNGKILALIKPQFEGKREQVGKGGIVREQTVIDEIVALFLEKAQAKGFTCLGMIPSAVHGAKGNREVFCLLETR